MSPPWRKPPAAEELAEEAELRRKIYRAQAAAFLDPPDGELVGFLAENYPFLFPGGAPAEEEALRALRVDFTELFVLSAPPYEAALLDESGHLNAAATDRVTDFYRACGYNPGRGSAGAGHPGVAAMDHLSAELEFLAHLAEGERDAWRAGDRPRALERLALSARFLDEHLLRWMPILAASVEEEAQTGFYRGLAAWTREFALADRRRIEEVRRAG